MSVNIKLDKKRTYLLILNDVVKGRVSIDSNTMKELKKAGYDLYPVYS
jgi:hypothetical protein